jgi:hypothetical protein
MPGEIEPRPSAGTAPASVLSGPPGQGRSGDLGDILERVLDKGIVIAGDIQINLLDIELLTIRLRLLIASVDTAREIGINWWETDPRLSSGADHDRQQLEAENRRLRKRLERLERRLEPADDAGDEADG